MLRFIQKLRHKPKAVRENAALGAAGAITALVIGAWLFVTPERVSTVASDVAETPGAFSMLFEQVKNQTANIADSVSDLRTTVEEEELLAPYVATSSTSSVTTTAVSDTSTSTGPVASTSATTTSERTVRIATTTPKNTETTSE